MESIPCSWIGRFKILKLDFRLKLVRCPHYNVPKAIYRVSAIPIRMPMAFFAETEKKNPKIHMES